MCAVVSAGSHGVGVLLREAKPDQMERKNGWYQRVCKTHKVQVNLGRNWSSMSKIQLEVSLRVLRLMSMYVFV